MKVGYVSQLNLKGIDSIFYREVDRLVNESELLKLDYLIVSGGISYNYKVSLTFIKNIGDRLKELNIGFRFVFGNIDLYYKDEVIDKEKKVKEIISTYARSPYYLPNNAIITRNVRIIGAESWYDYSLYRGKPRDLKDISKKRWLIFKANDDNKYITNKSDYSLGLNNTFDIRYSKQCAYLMKNNIESYRRKHGDSTYSVVVTYFNSSKGLLGNTPLDEYMGAFEGCSVYHDICVSNKVTDYVVGHASKKSAIIDGIRYLGSNKKIKVVNYD